MFLEQFHSREGDTVTITKEQGSHFAKSVADDFNPLHNADAKRFCVPGDLLFSLIVSQYGLSSSMEFAFVGMVGNGVELDFSDKAEGDFILQDNAGKAYVDIKRNNTGAYSTDAVEAFIRQYVAFSGHNFPHILVPLMEQHGVMINPKRPMVMYERMSFELDVDSISAPVLSLADSILTVDGKRGEVALVFEVKDGDVTVGRGRKKLLLSGLMPYDEAAMQSVCDNYDGNKQAYAAIYSNDESSLLASEGQYAAR